MYAFLKYEALRSETMPITSIKTDTAKSMAAAINKFITLNFTLVMQTHNKYSTAYNNYECKHNKGRDIKPVYFHIVIGSI